MGTYWNLFSLNVSILYSHPKSVLAQLGTRTIYSIRASSISTACGLCGMLFFACPVFDSAVATTSISKLIVLLIMLIFEMLDEITCVEGADFTSIYFTFVVHILNVLM